MLPRRFLVKSLRRGDPPTLLGFLATHFEYGQLEQHSYDSLCEVVLCINRISKILFEEPRVHGSQKESVDVHQTPSAEADLAFAFDAIARLEAGASLESFSQADLARLYKRPEETTDERVDKVVERIEEICDVFGEHAAMRCTKAEDAMRLLPELSGVLSDEQVCERMSNWADVLFFLHEPNDMDTRMYRNFLIYFDQFVHAPYIQRCRSEPDTRSEDIAESLQVIREMFEDLTYLCECANNIVRELRKEYAYARHVHRLVMQDQAPPESPLQMPVLRDVEKKPTMEEHIRALEELDAFFDADDEATFTPPQSTKSSFSDGTVFTPPQSTSTSFNDSTYAAVTARSRNPSFRSATQARTRNPSSTIPRTVSRVFTGSFEDLERGVTDLELHRTPSGNPIEPKVRDFAPPVTPRMLPSPRTLLARSEACKRDDVEEVSKRKKFGDKGRAATVDERSLSGWLGIEGVQRPRSAVERGRKATI